MIRREKYGGMIINVWIECNRCGYRTGSTYEDQDAGDNSSGAKFAAKLWNSTKARERK